MLLTSRGRFSLVFRAISLPGVVVVASGIVAAERLPLKSALTTA